MPASRNVNYGMQALLMGSSKEATGYAFYINGTDVDYATLTSFFTYPLTAANGKYYTICDGGPAYPVSVDVVNVAVVTYPALANAQVYGPRTLLVDSNEIIYYGDFKSGGRYGVTKLDSAQVYWGNSIGDFTGVSAPDIWHQCLYDDRLFVLGDDSFSYDGFLLEVDTDDPTTEAIGARLAMESNLSNYDFLPASGICSDTVNEQIMMAQRHPTDASVVQFAIYGANDTTSTPLINSCEVDDTSESWSSANSLGRHVHYDSKNDQYVFAHTTFGGMSKIYQLASDLTSLDGHVECGTLGDIIDSCMDAAGNIYLLTADDEIVSLDDTLAVRWQSAVSVSGNTIFAVKGIAYESESDTVGVVGYTTDTRPYCFLLTVPAAGGVGTYTFTEVNAVTPDDFSIAAMTADTWSATSDSYSATATEVMNEQGAASMALTSASNVVFEDPAIYVSYEQGDI